MGASEVSRRAFEIMHGTYKTQPKPHIYKYAMIALLNSEETCYELMNTARVYMEKEVFNSIYEETRGQAIILLVDDARHVGETDMSLEQDEFKYLSLYGQSFNPKWEYDEKTGEYKMYGGNDLVSKLRIDGGEW